MAKALDTNILLSATNQINAMSDDDNDGTEGDDCLNSVTDIKCASTSPSSLPNGINVNQSNINSITVNNDLNKIKSNGKSNTNLNLVIANERNWKKKAKIQINPLHNDDDKEQLLSCNSIMQTEDKPVLRVQFNANDSSSSSSQIPPKKSNQQDCSPSPEKEHLNAPPLTSSASNSSSSTSLPASSSSSSVTIEISEARPPDGGWGWVVVMASFVVNLIADGITFSFGVIYVELLNYFRENRGTTAWVGGLFMAMPLLSGPVASFLTDRYGCRKVTMFGAVLASTGFVISSRADSMFVLCITFGVLAGFGLSLCYVASVVIVAYYFDKRRSFATGLAVCGSGIGTFIFAPVIQMLLNEYGWRGTTLILAGLFLNLAVCGALMRDLPWTSAKQKSLARQRKKDRELKRKKKLASADSFSVSTGTCTASVLQPIIESQEENEFPDMLLNSRLYNSVIHLPTFIHEGEKLPVEVLESLATNKDLYNILATNYPNLLLPSKSFSDSGRLNESTLSSKHAHTTTQLSPPALESKDDNVTWWMNRKNVPILPKSRKTDANHLSHVKKSPAAFLKDLRIHRLSVTYRGAMLNLKRYRLKASSCPDIYRNSMTTIEQNKTEWYAAIWDVLVDMFDFSYFTDPKYLVFALSNFLLYTWYDVPYVYLTDNAKHLGYNENDASILVSIIGIINMIGEIVLGWAGDRSWINASIIYAICMVLCGGVVALIPLITDYTWLIFSSGAFGFLIAANYSLTCVILVEQISLERFPSAYGLLLLVQGFANLIGPPIGGWLYDITGTYHLSFYLAGLFIALSGLMMIILPITNKWKQWTGDKKPTVSTTAMMAP